ncbi:MAG: ATP synthase subunit C [Clostridia bacterium]|jgi:V/A-type H+-transporting ATPase subunit K|nr:ATP synthase subunit C [Clostridia bacterium]
MKDLLIGALVLVVLLSAAGIVYWKKTGNPKSAKTVMAVNMLLIFGILMTATIIMLTGGRALAAEVPAATAETASNSDGLRYLAAALSTGLATIGTGIAVAASASAALGAISEDSSLLGKTIIFVGLAEGIAIYGLIVSILILP